MTELEKKKLIIRFIMRTKSYHLWYWYEFQNFIKSLNLNTRLYDLSIEELEIVATRISENLITADKWEKSEEKRLVKSDA